MESRILRGYGYFNRNVTEYKGKVVIGRATPVFKCTSGWGFRLVIIKVDNNEENG